MSDAPWLKRKKAQGKEKPQAMFQVVTCAIGLLMPMNALLRLGTLVTMSHWRADLGRGKSGIGPLKRKKRALTRARNLSAMCSTEGPLAAARMALLGHALLV
jgi:hypothetical protein